MMKACAPLSSVAASSANAPAQTNGTPADASPPTSVGTPKIQRPKVSSRPPRHGMACGDGTGPGPRRFADAQYHENSGSSRPSIATTIWHRNPPTPSAPYATAICRERPDMGANDSHPPTIQAIASQADAALAV